MKIRTTRKPLVYVGSLLLASLALPVWAAPASSAAPATTGPQAGTALQALPTAPNGTVQKALPYGAGFEQRQRHWWRPLEAGKGSGTGTGATSGENGPGTGTPGASGGGSEAQGSGASGKGR
jgi:hypothetical protein